MSIAGYLTCPARKLSIRLGKPLRDTDGRLTQFDHPKGRFADALWSFLEECSDERLVLADSGGDDFDTVAAYREIGGWVEDGNIPFDDYLVNVAEGRFTYHARLGPGHPRTAPTGVVRRRHGDVPLDEAFTRNLRWEPTDFLRRVALGLDDADHVEITETEAADFVLRLFAYRLRPGWSVDRRSAD